MIEVELRDKEEGIPGKGGSGASAMEKEKKEFSENQAS